MGLTLDRLLTYAEDTAHTDGDEGQYILAVTQDTLASSAADGDYSSFKVNSKGELYMKDTDAAALLTTIDADTSNIATDTSNISTDTGNIATSVASIDTDTSTIASDTTSMDATLTALSKSEDAPHVSGDQGLQMLAVRNDAGTTLVSDDGDYSPLSVDSSGNLRVAAEFAVPNAAIAAGFTSVGTSEVKLPATPLASRDEITIQNRGTSGSVFIGPTGVTTSTGIEIGKRSSMTIALGPSVDIFGISGIASQNVRTFETS